MFVLNRFVFTMKELTEILIRASGTHEGIWEAYVSANLAGQPSPDQAAAFGQTPSTYPAFLLRIVDVGIRQVQKEGEITVDAAVVNPSLPEMKSQLTHGDDFEGKKFRGRRLGDSK